MTPTEKQARTIADELSRKENQDLSKEELVELLQPFIRATYVAGEMNGVNACTKSMQALLDHQKEVIKQYEKSGGE